jgi:hypothetical protein
VQRHAPLIHIHPDEAYSPVHPDQWLEESSLFWYEEERQELVAESALDLFARGPADFAFRGRRLTEITRPWESTRASGEPLASGFALTTGNDPTTSERNEAGSVPLFYEHVEGAYVTYWLFYPWSTVPDRIPSQRTLGLEALETVDPAEADEAALALREAYPDLVHAASPSDALEGVPSPRELLTFVRAWFGARWPVLHEGDWEGLSVSLAPEQPRVAYFQHGRPQERPLGRDERPRVYVALGSHASYPDLDAGSEGSPRIKRFERLAQGELMDIELIDVHAQGWYGFGGAWGAPGRISDETGPLGPGESKGPRPFARPAS